MVMFERIVPVGRFICSEGNMIPCYHPGFVYFARTQHAINVLVSRENCVDRHFCAPRPSNSNRIDTVLWIMQGNGKRLQIDRAFEFVNTHPITPPDDVIKSVTDELSMLHMDLDTVVASSSGESDIYDACDHLSDAFINVTRAAPDRMCNALFATMTK